MPRADPSSSVHAEPTPPEKDAVTPAFAVEMPGSESRNSREIEDASPEGLPADPKAGPGTLYRFIALCVVLLAIGSLLVVPLIGWAGGAMALGFTVLALVLNPGAIATVHRAGERRRILESRSRHTKDTSTSRTTRQRAVNGIGGSSVRTPSSRDASRRVLESRPRFRNPPASRKPPGRNAKPARVRAGQELPDKDSNLEPRRVPSFDRGRMFPWCSGRSGTA
jgi:hypothetical protein